MFHGDEDIQHRCTMRNISEFLLGNIFNILSLSAHLFRETFLHENLTQSLPAVGQFHSARTEQLPANAQQRGGGLQAARAAEVRRDEAEDSGADGPVEAGS